MVNRKETNLDGVKAMARTLLYTDINKTAYSPIVVQHPFTNTGFTMVMRNGEPQCIDITADSNALHEWRKMVCQQIDSSKSAFEIYMLTNKPYGMTFLKYAAHHLSKKDFSQILADAWIRSENPNDDPNLPQAKLLSLFQSAEPRHLMSQDELNTLNDLDATVTVYRGVTSFNAKNVIVIQPISRVGYFCGFQKTDCVIVMQCAHTDTCYFAYFIYCSHIFLPCDYIC